MPYTAQTGTGVPLLPVHPYLSGWTLPSGVRTALLPLPAALPSSSRADLLLWHPPGKAALTTTET